MVVQWWYNGGAMVVQWWCNGGTNLGDMEYEETSHTRSHRHGNGHSVRRINKQLLGQHQAKGSADPYGYDHYIHRHTDESRVIDVEVFDIAAFIGQKESEYYKETFIDIHGAHQVRKGIAVTFFILVCDIKATFLEEQE